MKRIRFLRIRAVELFSRRLAFSGMPYRGKYSLSVHDPD